MTTFDATLAIAIIANGLLAGLFFAFTCALSPALGRLDDHAFVEAFRAVNAVILNGWFLSVFFLAPAVAIVSAVWGGVARQPSLPWLVTGAICAVITFVITVAANVPLNHALDTALTTTSAQYRAARLAFEAAWNRWNLARTFTSVGALGLLSVATLG